MAKVHCSPKHPVQWPYEQKGIRSELLNYSLLIGRENNKMNNKRPLGKERAVL